MVGACSHKTIRRRIYGANAPTEMKRSGIEVVYCIERYIVSKRKIPRNRKVSGVFLLVSYGV